MSSNITDMLRFYVKRVGNEYHVMNNAQYAGKSVFTEQELYGCAAPFAEIRITAGMRVSTIVSVDALDVAEIKAPALKAADDHNITVIAPKADELPRKTSQDLRETFQEFIDRSQLYGTSFESEFAQLLEKFPVKVQVKDNYYRQVTL
jgi:hypothetical protein